MRLRAGSLPDSGGFDVEPWVLDQDGEQSCTGHAVAEMLYLKTGRRTSPQFPWSYARAHDVGSFGAIANAGVTAGALTRALDWHGTCRFEEWNRWLAGYERDGEPSAIARLNAQHFLIELRPILSSGDALVERIVDSLHRKQPTCVTVDVDDEYLESRGYVGPQTERGRGLHLIACDRFRRRTDGRYDIRTIGSYGTGHGDRGLTWLHPDRVGKAAWVMYLSRVRNLR